MKRAPFARPAKTLLVLAAVFILAVALASCDALTGPGGIIGFRTYALGFTTFPYAMTTEAVLDTWTVIATDGDMAVLHYDGGVPWQEALDGAGYPDNFANDLEFSSNMIPGGHVTYLAVTPINNRRNGLALNRGDLPNEPLPAPWDGYAFDDPDVISAYKNHCDRVVDAIDPDYFAYGIEVNSLRWLSPGMWDAYVTMTADVYAHLKSRYPDLPVFLTFQADAFHGSPSSQTAAIQDVLPYTDVVAVSGYPFTNPFLSPLGDPLAVRADYFTSLSDLSPDKPFAIAETAWPAEPVGDPYWLDIPATEETQLQYVERVFEDCEYLDALFVCWFFSRDYDDVWDEYFQYDPEAGLLRTWRDTGLYSGNGDARQALGLWLLALERQLAYP
ncbi:MAG: hypothetical protein ABIG03_02445 [Candidatus Eisenbacteria bacterium]